MVYESQISFTLDVVCPWYVEQSDEWSYCTISRGVTGCLPLFLGPIWRRKGCCSNYWTEAELIAIYSNRLDLGMATRGPKCAQDPHVSVRPCFCRFD